ncbi:MAG: hypothetical protein HC878_00290 [Leptolyngbyaceae cyanobacterium SL_5_14]|nr:hypothetical protein [Leptolyngbyaceae cyanobacterium SL_5_14]
MSKSFDMIVQEIALRQYGRILLKPLNWLLSLAASSAGIRNSSVFASGLDKFNLDSLTHLVKILGEIAPFEDRIAPTALRLFYAEIQSQW